MPGAVRQPVSRSVPIETLNRFTASIIHKVSNPLSIIIGNAQYLLLKLAEERGKEVDGTEELSSTAQAILNESMRLASLMSQLLGFSSKLTNDQPTVTQMMGEIEGFLGKTAATPPEEVVRD